MFEVKGRHKERWSDHVQTCKFLDGITNRLRAVSFPETKQLEVAIEKKKKHELINIKFCCSVQFSVATIMYVYNTCYTIRGLIRRCSNGDCVLNWCQIEAKLYTNLYTKKSQWKQVIFNEKYILKKCSLINSCITEIRRISNCSF